MKKLVVLISLYFFTIHFTVAQSCQQSTKVNTIEGGNLEVSVGIGDLWWNGNDGEYFFPKRTENKVSAVFAGSFWINGIDEDESLCGAFQTYGRGSGKRDWWAGPNGTPQECIDWDRHFVVSKEEIQSSQNQFQQGNLDPANIPINVLLWPSTGNPYLESVYGFVLPDQAHGFASFLDANADGIYDPLQGDYPLIDGATTATYWVMNDFGNNHSETYFQPLRFEVQTTAYTYDTGETALDNSTVYKARIINKGTTRKRECTFSLWMDTDLGCPQDDFTGCLPEENLAFYYNQDAVDGSSGNTCGGYNTYGNKIPVIGVKLIKGLTDENGATSDMLGHFYFTNSSIGEVQENPLSNYYNFAFGGEIAEETNNGISLPFAYEGNPSDPNTGAACNNELIETDIKTVTTFGRFDLQPGQVNEVVFSITGIEDVPHPCPDINALVQATNIVKSYYKEESLLSSTSVLSNKHSIDILLYPNPVEAQGTVTIELLNKENSIQSILVYDQLGRNIEERKNLNTSQVTMETAAYAKGIYFVKVSDQLGNILVKKMVLN